MKFAIATLGCKVNQYESQRIREAFLARHYVEQSFAEPGADLYIINTCTVTHKTDAENRRLIRKALRYGGQVVATGCQAVTAPEAIQAISKEIEVVKPGSFETALGISVPHFISGFEGHSRAFVAIQQGCNNFCTYCIVPFSRGLPVSRPPEEIIREINTLVQAGYHEVVLSGINIGLYEGGLAGLVSQILDQSATCRVRISSIEPWTLEDELVGIIASDPRICKHMHLPLQSGSDNILKAMGRPYKRLYYRTLIERIRAGNREIAIGSDVMVGFPGEDEQCFTETLEFIQSLELAYLHVFPYSQRRGTAAAAFNAQVDPKEKQKRSAVLRQLSHKKRMAFAISQIGSIQDLLVTSVEKDTFRGITSNYLKCSVAGKNEIGNMVRVKVTSTEGAMLIGHLYG